MWVPTNQSFRYGKFQLENPFRLAMVFCIIKINSIHKSLILILPIWLNNKYCICMSFTEEKCQNWNSHLYKGVILTKINLKLKRMLSCAAKKAKQQPTMRVISYVSDTEIQLRWNSKASVAESSSFSCMSILPKLIFSIDTLKKYWNQNWPKLT